MSDADATDPVKAVKALREFTALPLKWPGILDDRLASIMRDLSAFVRTCTAVDDGFARELDAFGKARALLSAAPALLARIEAGEARAERAESDLILMLASNDRYGAQLDSMTATVKALNARLAEVAPVVEAAERQEDANEAHANWTGEPDDDSCDELHGAWVKACCATDEAVRALRTARSLRGAGEQT